MIATGVVRGRPLFRPRMVKRPLKPSGNPAARRGLAIALTNGTYPGTRPGRVIATSVPLVAERSIGHILS